jgi:regulator of sirC expression with transglutaminase-like and TPR domain
VINSENDFLVTELSRIAQDIKSSWTLDQTLKKYRTLQQQLKSSPASLNAIRASEKLTALKYFFFNEKKFCPLASKPSLDKYLFPYTLLSRSGPTESLLLLFLNLARSLDLNIEIIDRTSSPILKIVEDGKSLLFDFNEQCRELSTLDVVELVNEGADCTKTLSAQELLTRYLILLKTQSLRERSLINFYKIQTHMIHLQPFALHHLVDRARAAYAIGDVMKAAEDLGQYVTFHSEKVTNSRYIKLLRKLRERHF